MSRPEESLFQLANRDVSEKSTAFFCGHSLMVKLQPSKLAMRVRFPLPALFLYKVYRVYMGLHQIFGTRRVLKVLVSKVGMR